jgi:CRP/FNR family transcriptional regulator
VKRTALSELDRIDILTDVSLAARRALADVGRTCHYDDGQMVVIEGQPDAPVFFVLEGLVRVFRTSLDGREQTLIRLGPGAALNMPAAFAKEEEGAPASAAAVGPVVLLSVSCLDFCRMTIRTPEIALAVLRDFAVKLHHLTDLTRDLGLLSVRARLAQFLLTCGYTPSDGQEENSTPVRWTHHEIAAQIGTVREVVSRMLRVFVKDGLIKMERHRIVVLDYDALASEAES